MVLVRFAGTCLALAQGMIDQLLARETYQLSLRLLDASVLRHEAIATNIANLETPGYKRVDLSTDFEQQLATFAARPESMSPKDLQPALAQDAKAVSTRPDGNNVQLDRELIEMNRNAAAFEFLSTYASDSLRRLKTAISGRTS